MKSKFAKILVFSLILILVFGTVYASAFESYDTYTYSINGEPLKSPAAYTPGILVRQCSSVIILPRLVSTEIFSRPI